MVDPDGRQGVSCADGVCFSVPAPGYDDSAGMRQLETDRVQGPSAALITAEVALIAADVVAGGPTGEGLVPAAALKSVRQKLLSKNNVGGKNSGATEAVPALSKRQQANDNRFKKKLPSGNTGTHVDELGDGVLATAEVPGKVPGSKAVYQKAIDGDGNTTAYLKTTFDNKGEIVHVKDKLKNN